MIKITKLKQISQKDYQRIVRRSKGNDKAILPTVRSIMSGVASGGDAQLVKYARQWIDPDAQFSLQVTQEEIDQAYQMVSSEFMRSIDQMIKNITVVQSAQLKTLKEPSSSPEQGIFVWREWRAIEKVGLYIPGGKAIYPSSVLMTGIPAKIAGCKEIVMCSPAKRDGLLPASTLVAADKIGIKKIFKVGGSEAIAAMLYGTETVPQVYKIFGAGNAYVTAAKMLAMESISVDMPAGPSEVFIIADETANPAYIAVDLLADGEHGEDSACVLVTTSPEIAKQTKVEIGRQIKSLPTKKYVQASLDRYGLIAIVDSLAEAVDFCNEYAPEHLEIMTKNAEKLVEKINNAGSVFLGNWTTKSSGDYATGANHVLPTGGMAKMYPPLGVDSYGKWMQIQKCTKSGLEKIRKTIEVLAETEGLPAHQVSTQIRFIESK